MLRLEWILSSNLDLLILAKSLSIFLFFCHFSFFEFSIASLIDINGHVLVRHASQWILTFLPSGVRHSDSVRDIARIQHCRCEDEQCPSAVWFVGDCFILRENCSGAQLQVHPNLDKKEWQATGLLKLKSANKPFPVSWLLIICKNEVCRSAALYDGFQRIVC